MVFIILKTILRYNNRENYFFCGNIISPWRSNTLYGEDEGCMFTIQKSNTKPEYIFPSKTLLLASFTSFITRLLSFM